jgi:hypothetical protein
VLRGVSRCYVGFRGVTWVSEVLRGIFTAAFPNFCSFATLTYKKQTEIRASLVEYIECVALVCFTLKCVFKRKGR